MKHPDAEALQVWSMGLWAWGQTAWAIREAFRFLRAHLEARKLR